MKSTNLIRRIWDETEFNYEQRECLKKAIAIRSCAVADGILKTFVKPQLEALLPSLGLIDEFPRNDRTPSIFELPRPDGHGLTTRAKFLDERRIVVRIEVPLELRSGVYDFALSMQIGLGVVRTDQMVSDADSQQALTNRLFWEKNPPEFRMTSATTAEEIAAEVGRRLKAVVKEAQAAPVAA